jgi:hypothetical protein
VSDTGLDDLLFNMPDDCPLPCGGNLLVPGKDTDFCLSGVSVAVSAIGNLFEKNHIPDNPKSRQWMALIKVLTLFYGKLLVLLFPTQWFSHFMIHAVKSLTLSNANLVSLVCNGPRFFTRVVA